MRQRAGIARTLAMNPKVILMDEPFSAVDHLTKCTLQEELINIRQAENKTVLFVTHDINEAVFLADRVVLLSPRPSTIQKIYEIPLEQKRGRNDPLLLKNCSRNRKRHQQRWTGYSQQLLGQLIGGEYRE